MIRSMTGYGRTESKSRGGHIRVEIKTTNHKFLEISSKLPGHLAEFEDSLRKLVSQELRRGKVNLFVASPDPFCFSSRLVLNESLAKEVFHKVKKLKQILSLTASRDAVREEEFILREVLRFQDVLTKDISYGQETLFFRDLQKVMTEALKKLKASRIFEGAAIQRDFLKRLFEIKKSVVGIEKRIPALSKEYRATLEKKIKEYLKAQKLDSERLTQEVTMYLKNSDISEEVTRLKSHMEAMKNAFKEQGEVGRKIDFIAQEMYREANTMGAKSSDVAIANHVIHIKSAIEKIREQTQNVE